MKKNLKILIPAIICIIIIVALIITTIVFACVNKSYKPEIVNPNTIKIMANGNQQTFEETDEDSNKAVYDNIVKLFNESFDETLLSSLFAGRMNNDDSVKYSSSSISEKFTYSNGIYLSFDYKDVQNIYQNGEKYTRQKTNSSIDEPTYKTLQFELKEAEQEGFNEITIYIFNSYSGSTSYSYYTYTTIADFTELYNYVNGLDVAKGMFR